MNLRTLGILLLLAPSILSPLGEGARASLEGRLPSPRLAMASAVLDGVVYLVGGRSGPSTLLDEIVRFDPSTGTSTVVARLPPSTLGPSGRMASTAAFLGSKLYIFGGAVFVNATLPSGGYALVPQSLPDIVEYDPTGSDPPRTLPDRLPRSLWGASAYSEGGAIFIVGGFHFEVSDFSSAGRLGEIVRFNPSLTTDRVRVVGSLPYKVQDAAMARVGTFVYLLGGLASFPVPNGSGTRESSAVVDWITRIEASTAKAVNLSALSPTLHLPTPRQFATASEKDGSIYLFGGIDPYGYPTEEIVEFRPSDGLLAVLKALLPGVRFSSSSATVGAKMYVFGGRDTGSRADGMDEVVSFIPGTTEPSAPRDLRITWAQDRILLSWSPPYDDGGSPIVEYQVYRISEDGSTLLVGSVPAGNLTMGDSNYTKGVLYTYRVVAVNRVGPSPQGAEGTFRAPTTPPGPPMNLQAFPENGSILLLWDPPLDDGGSRISTYRIYRDSDPSTSRPWATCPGDPSGGCLRPQGFRDRDVRNFENHSYLVVAVNSRGSSEPAGPVIAAASPTPPAPRNLTVLSQKPGEVNLVWEGVEGEGISYDVYRVIEGGPLEKVAQGLYDTYWIDRSVVNRTLYRYFIRATNAQGSSPPSNSVTVGIFVPPGPVRGLVATPAPSEIHLRWLPPEDPGGPRSNLTYAVLRAVGEEDPVYVASDLQVTNWTDRNVQASTTYRYFVEAINGAGKGPRVGPILSTPAPLTKVRPLATLTASAVRLEVGEKVMFDGSYSRDPDGRVVDYRFEFGDGKTSGWAPRPTVEHSYSWNGTFVARLWVRDNDGLESSTPAEWTVVVGPLPRNTRDDTAPSPAPPPPPPTRSRIPGMESFEGAVALFSATLLFSSRGSSKGRSP